MNHPENIIYIVLIVGSIIWSIAKKFIGKKEINKQPQPQSQPAQTPHPKKSLEDIFRELAGEIEPQPQSQPVVIQPIVQPIPQPVAKTQMIMNDALALEKRIVPNLSAPIELPQRNFAINLDNVSDWQHAFVYSEIFNRKY